MPDPGPTLEIDKPDYALLNAVSSDQWLVYLLAAEAGMENIINMPSHGLPERELAEHFFRLWTRGLIECRSDESGPPVAPDLDLVRAQFEYTGIWPGDKALFYGLSASGGVLWEALTAPQWTEFVRVGSGPSHNTWVLSGGDRGLVERFRRRLGAGFCGPPPIPGTERWEVMQPWRPTYWKTLPLGCQFTFQHTGDLSYSIDAETWDAADCYGLHLIGGTWRRSVEEVCQEYFEGR
jgi:hypothetical protein